MSYGPLLSQGSGGSKAGGLSKTGHCSSPDRCRSFPPMSAYLYILASRAHGTLYIGSTINLLNRLEQHRADVPGSFTAKYKVHRLVYFEHYDHIADARRREAQMKRWKRQWKIDLIEALNPTWRDLASVHF